MTKTIIAGVALVAVSGVLGSTDAAEARAAGSAPVRSALGSLFTGGLTVTSRKSVSCRESKKVFRSWIEQGAYDGIVRYTGTVSYRSWYCHDLGVGRGKCYRVFTAAIDARFRFRY